MKQIKLGNSALEVPEIGLGCMRITGLGSAKAVRELIDTAMDCGISFFDHADIYAKGEAERVFGVAVGPALREKIIIQTKCAIRPGVCYDFSKEYILKSVEGSLTRLNTDHIDILLLHRPDTLMEPDEVAEAFTTLKQQGKVGYFGVSNANPGQIELLNHYCGNKIIVDQLQLSIAHCDIIDSGLNVNIHNDAGIDRDGGILEYCRLKGITIQAWSPFQYGTFEGVFLGNDKFPELNRLMDELAEKYHVTNNAIAVAWILRHPAKIQTIVGSTNRQRIIDISQASGVTLTREEWYALYLAAGKQLP
ncbi:MAG: aldo/keto reductase family oxidoreductase [Clostridiales bacterium]|nr:aldo/keto reductase family oxidoreductase [Clostridiales bacterium]